MTSSWYTVVGRIPRCANETHWFLAESYDDAVRQFSDHIYLETCDSPEDADADRDIARYEVGTQYLCFIDAVIVTDTASSSVTTLPDSVTSPSGPSLSRSIAHSALHPA